MYKRVSQNSLVVKSVAKLIFAAILTLLICTTNAAEQGKYGKSSSGSIDISIYVSQTLDSISPNALLLDKNHEDFITESFCITHQGHDRDTQVPYELIVDDFKTVNTSENEHSQPFDIYLEDKNTHNSKQQLKKGVSISTLSSLRFDKNVQTTCENSGLQLSIRENKKNAKIVDSLGVMVLLVSPK